MHPPFEFLKSFGSTSEGPHVAVGGVSPQAVMSATTQPCDSHSMKGKENESRKNPNCSFPNLFG